MTALRHDQTSAERADDPLPTGPRRELLVRLILGISAVNGSWPSDSVIRICRCHCIQAADCRHLLEQHHTSGLATLSDA